MFYGWRVVAAGFIMNAVNDGTFFFGFSILFLPISRDLNLSRTATSLPFTLNRALMTVLGPLLGYVIDRFGTSSVLMLSGIVGGLGFVLLRWTDSYLVFALVLVGLINLGMMGLIPSATAAVVPWFKTRRSLAMAVCNTGWSVGIAVIPPMLAVGVATLGWRTTAVIVGIGIWVVVIPLSRIFRNTPQSMGLPPDGVRMGSTPPQVSKPEIGTGRSQRSSGDMTLREAVRSPSLWLVSLAMGFHGMIISAVSVHMVAIMTWKGLSETSAGYLVGVWAFFMAPMIIIMGLLGDKWSKGRVSAMGLFVRAIGWFLLLTWMDGEIWQMVVILLLLSPDFAIFSLSMAVIADWTGARHYATIRGTMQSLSGVMGMGMPIYAGWIFDKTDSYTLVVLPALVLTIVAGATFWLLPKPKVATRLAEPVAAAD